MDRTGCTPYPMGPSAVVLVGVGVEVIGSQLFLEPSCTSEETIPRCGKIRHGYLLDRAQQGLVSTGENQL